MSTYVLVPGAWLGGWIWDDVAAHLQTRGHRAVPVTLTGLDGDGHVDGAAASGAEIDLDVHAQDVVTAVESCGEEVVLVAHSYAGLPVSMALDRVRGSLQAVVFVDSGEFADGESFLDTMPAEAGRRMRDEAIDGWGVAMPPPDVLGQQASLAGLDDATLRTMRERARPHPIGTYLQPVRRAARDPDTTPRALVVCTAGGLSIPLVGQLAASGTPGFTLVTPRWRMVALDTGHWPMLSEPALTAAALDEVVGHPEPTGP